MTSLGEKEQVLWEGTRAWADFVVVWIGGAFFLLFGATLAVVPEARLFAVFVVFFSLLFPGGIWLDRVSRRYTITSERAIAKRGLISRRVSEIELKHIRDLRMTQSIFQRIFGIGSLELSSAGRAGAEVVFAGISDPESVKELIRKRVRESS